MADPPPTAPATPPPEVPPPEVPPGRSDAAIEQAARALEHALVPDLQAFLAQLTREAPLSGAETGTALETLDRLIREGASPSEKAAGAARLLGLYAVPGALRDFPWSREADVAREALYRRLVDLRGVYRKLAGTEGPELAAFPVLAVGARVRLVPGRDYHVDAGGNRYAVTPAAFPPGEVWRVDAARGLDVTGIPTYAISRDGRTVEARVTALESVGTG